MKKTFFCIDAHTCGNPVRLVAGGGPFLKGKDMSEKRQHFIKEYDWIRKGLMFEPRGHDMMSGSILYPPSNSCNDVAILFIETSGCLPMCGHGTIGSITIAIEEGLITPNMPGSLLLETPAGLVKVKYKKKGKKVSWVQFTNVPSFLAAENLAVNCPELGTLNIDVAYGGNFYAIIDKQENFKGMEYHAADELVRFSQFIRKEIAVRYPNAFIHPENNTIKGVSHIQWTGAPLSSEASGRNAVFYGNKAIDRSPCGTGTSARMAQLYHKGKLKKGENFIHESIIGSQFIGCIEKEIDYFGKKAIVPSIKGWAKIYGYNTLFIDDEDPFTEGFEVI